MRLVRNLFYIAALPSSFASNVRLNLNSCLFAFFSLFGSSLALAGGGDMSYQGLLDDKLHAYSFDTESTESTVIPLLPHESHRAMPITITPFKTFETVDPTQPPPPTNFISGCLVLLEDSYPLLLVCTDSASEPAFRRALYSFSGKFSFDITGRRYPEKGAKFTCVSRCSKQIPRYFELFESE